MPRSQLFSFIAPSLILFFTVLVEGQVILQTENVEKVLNSFNYSRGSYLREGLPKWVGKIDIPSHVQEFLNLFQESSANGFRDNFINATFEGVSNDDCKGHILEWSRILSSPNMTWSTPKDQWAIEMIDAWGKIPEGMLTGHFSSYGDFDECVHARASDIEVLNKRFPDVSKSFEGRYCTSSISDYATAMAAAGRSPASSQSSEEKINSLLEIGSATGAVGVMQNKAGVLMVLPLTTAACMPSSCSAKDVQNIFVNAASMLYGRNANVTQLPWPLITNCAVDKKPDFDAAVIFVIFLLSFLLVLCVGTGVIDYLLNHGVEKPVERGKAYKYLMAFSFYSNTKKWLSTRRTADDLGCLHGIRFLSTAWVVLGHTYATFMSGPQWNLFDFFGVWKNWTVLAIVNGTFSVDTFFVMSGMLATYNILKLLDKTKGKLNVPMFYVHRYLRLTPTYAILIGIAATLITYLGSGPLWYGLSDNEVCRKSWWVNLLYINNIKSDEMCNGESWYLANDMQFYFLSPFIVYPIWRWRKIGLPLLALYTVLSCISPVLIAHFEETPVGMIITRGDDLMLHMKKLYFPPWTRIQTFLVGVWLGWILHLTKGKRMKLPVWVVAGGWLASAALASTVIFAIQPWFDATNEIPKAAGLFYAGLSRLTFGVAIAWVIFACVKGYGGIVNNFLSWKVFMPLRTEDYAFVCI